MQKPPPCYQDWDAMKKVSGGRLCEQCQNTIVDFTKMTWEDILAKQEASNYSTCGKYSKRQLRHWGHQPPAVDLAWFRKMSFAGLLVLLGLKSVDAQNVKKPKVEFSVSEATNANKEPTDTIIFKGQIINSATNEGFAYATILLPNKRGGVYTDADGKFSLKVPIDLVENGTVKVEFKYVNIKDITFKLHQDSLNKFYLGKDDIEFVGAIYFRVAELTFTQKLKRTTNRIKSWFKKD